MRKILFLNYPFLKENSVAIEKPFLKSFPKASLLLGKSTLGFVQLQACC